MKSHVWRPLLVVIGLALLIFAAGQLYVPADFGAQERGYMYGYHRAGNEQEAQKLVVMYRGNEACRDCHAEKLAKLVPSRHHRIPCEDCHGPIGNHPDNPPKLAIDRSRELCLRCHAGLSMPSSQRNDLPRIDNLKHNPGTPCSDCHNPHHPELEAM